MKPIEIYDNGGKSFDRYTIFINGLVYGASTNALSPQGFFQFVGFSNEIDKSALGKRIDFEALPSEVKEQIRRIEAVYG